MAIFSRLESGIVIWIAKPRSVWRAILPFNTAQLIEIDDDPLADLAADRYIDRKTARRHVYSLAGEFTPIGEHVTAKQL